MKRFLAALLIGLLVSPAYASDSSITTPDAGKKLDTHEVSTGAGTVHRQGVVVCDPDTNLCAAVSAAGVKTNPRNLAHGTDSIQIGDGVDLMVVNPGGSLNVVASGTVAATQSGTWTVQSAQSGTWTIQAQQNGTWNIRLQDAAGNGINSLSTNPVGSEQGLIVRNIPSGTQTVSGTVTANVGTTNGLALDSTLTGGSAKAVVRGAAKGGTSAADATVSSVDANSNALDVFIRGGAGAGGTSAQDNTGFVGGSSAVTPMGALFDNTPPSITDGNVGIPLMTSGRHLIVACPTCPGGTGGTALQDEAGFTEGSGSGTPIMGVFNDTISSDPTEDQAAVIRMTAKRGLHTNLRNTAGTEVGTAGAPLRVDPTGSTTQPVSIPGGVSVSGTVTANLGTLNGAVTEKAQGSTTSGQSGPLVQGAVTTNAPSYTNAQTSPLNMTTAGDLRVVAATGHADRTASGNIAGAGQSVAISLQGLQGVSYAVTGTWTATLRCQVTSDGSTWVDVDSYSPAVEALISDVTGNGQYSCDLPGGMQQARVTANAYTSGTAAIALRANMVPARSTHAFDRPAGQSLPNHTALIGGSDGTNIQNAGAFDVDSGGGVQYVLGTSIRLSNSGGSVEGGTASNPLRIDPTGSTIQPVSGTVSSVAAGPAASGAAASGNPVQGGAVFRTTQPTVSNGQVVENQATARGAQIVATGVDAFVVDSEMATAAALSDTTANPTTTVVGAANMVWDGSNWVRAKQAANGMDTAATGIPVGAVVGQFDDTSPSTITENQFGIARSTPNRAIHVNLRAQDGSELSVGGGTQYDQGTASGAADKLTMAGAIRRDSAALDAGVANGDRAAMSTDSSGRLWVNCGAGCASAGDTVGSTQALGALNNAAGVALSGQRGADFFLAAGTLTGTITPEVSLDGGTTYAAAVFINVVTGAVETSIALTNPNSALSRVIGWIGSATHVRVRVSAYTSGTADGTARAVTNSTLAFLTGTDGSTLRTAAVSSAGALSVAYGSGNFATNATQIGGAAIDANSGNKSGGTQRIVIATDQPTLTSPLFLPGTGATDWGKAEDAAHTTGDVGIMALAVRTDTASQRAQTDGEYSPLITDASGRLHVNVGAVPSNQTVNVNQIAGTATSVNNGAVDAGTMRVTIANNSTGTVAATQSGTWTVQPGNTANSTPWLVTDNGATSGGTSTCYITSAASTNSTNCKASAGQLYNLTLVNTTATTYYLRLYNLSSAPTCSSATGFIATIPVLATGGVSQAKHVGQAFGTGIGFCLTGGGSSTDNSNAATGVYITLEYK